MENKHLIDTGQLKVFGGMTRARVQTIFEGISQVKAAVIGDACLDVYWDADMTLSNLSRETPHHPLPVVNERVSPGAAGNVATNLQVLGCQEISFLSAVANDWRGDLLHRCFAEKGINDSYSLKLDQWITPAYCKPIRHGLQGSYQEDPRLDFVNRRTINAEEEQRIIEALDRVMLEADVLAVTDQLPLGIITEAVRERLQYWAQQGKPILIDSRDRIARFKGSIIKPNEVEALQALGVELQAGEFPWQQIVSAGQKLYQQNGAPCCITIGARGAIWFDEGTPVWVPGIPVSPPIDIVGAGDHFAASFLSALGAKCSGPEAMFFAQLGSAVVIRKLGTTGTANQEEILARYDELAGMDAQAISYS